MTLPIVFRRAALAEYSAAARWYESRAAGVGYRFVERVEQTLALIAESPRRPATILANIRRARTRDFPFFIYYVVEDSRTVVLAVLHARRNPATWRRRR
jgi:plasmid stabilization system protein ParE